jgi:N-acetyl-anhydromuramyl-L-alanine amidase AmpD
MSLAMRESLFVPAGPSGAGRLRCAGLVFFLVVGAAAVRGQPDYPPALWNPAYTNHWYTTGYSHSFCVIHDMEGFYEATISYFQQSGTQASAHYCINGLQNGSDNQGHVENNPADAPAGEITQMVREQYWAWHVLCWNRYMFGTEHEGFVTSPVWYSEAMYQASAGLQRHLCEVWGIPMDRNHIIGHDEWQNAAWVAWMAVNWTNIDTSCNNHTDPGQYWDWTHFMALITSNGVPPSITAQPASLTVAQGNSATFSVTANGPAPLNYQWAFNQASIPGATGSIYTIASAQVTDAGAYAVLVTNTGGAIASTYAFLSVLAPLTNASGCILAPVGMVDWWPAEGNANDLFGSWNGTPQNGFSYTPGKQGLAFHFDGSTGYLSTGAPSIPPPWTAVLWVNRQNAFGAAAALMGDGTNELKLEQYNAARQVGFTHLGVGDYSFGYLAPTGTWVHLAFVGTTTNTSLYANGVRQAALTNTIPLPRTYIGAGYVNSSSRVIDYMLGSVDEILLFNRALSASEINSIYAAGSAGLCRAPEFTRSDALGNGQFSLNLRGQTGKGFTLYGSTNLVNWSVLGSLSNPVGTNQFVDATATNSVRKFYRASQP